MTADVHETVAARLREVDQRYTTGRRRLVDRLAQAAQPVTLPELLGSGRERLPQSSAYRNLSVLEEAGVVNRLVTTGDFARYELAEDLTEHHHHLICSTCGAVVDFTVPAGLERTVRRVMGEVGAATGFQADGHRLDLIGTCSACA